MIIFWSVAKCLSEYLDLMKRGKLGCVERPRECQKCGGDCFWAHGTYRRIVDEDDDSAKIAIARFKCSWCGKTVSVLPCFVIPRRRYGLRTVARGIESYATKPETYKEGATKLGAVGPSAAQLFCWVALLVERAQELLLDVQSWCVSASIVEEELLKCETAECPNSWKAQVPGKAQLLDDLAKVISYGRRLLEGTGDIVMTDLGMRFLNSVEGMQQIFAHRGLWKQTPQRVKP